MKVHLYDFRWIDKDACEFQASANGKFGRKSIKLGDSLSLGVESEPFCAGSVFEGEWKPCPENAKGKHQCDLCRQRERNFVYTMFDGFNRDNFTDSDLMQIQGDHVIYLALFDRELVKIGVSRAERKALRQLEQGSQATLFIGQANDGVKARQIETLVRKSGIADKIKPSQKQDFLLPDITKEQAEQELKALWEKHKDCLKKYERLTPQLKNEPEFVWWADTYGLGNVQDSTKQFHTVKLKPEEWVSGTIRVIKGPFLILETPDELVSICAKDLQGRIVDFSVRGEGLELKNALQNSLF